MRTKFETVAAIFSLMYDANLADSERSADWQTPDMVLQRNGLYGDLSRAADKILGKSFYAYLMSGDGICLDSAGIADAWNRYVHIPQESDQ